MDERAGPCSGSPGAERWSDGARRRWAFWLREPGAGEIRPVPLPRAGPGRRARPDAPLRRSAGAPRRWSSTGGCPASQYDAMRAPFQEGDFPGPVKYGYLSVGVVEHGPPALLGTHRLLPAPPPDGVRRARAAVTVVPPGVPGGAGGARGPRRDGRQRALGRRAARRRPGRGRGGRRAGVLRGAAARPDPRRHGHPGRRRPVPRAAVAAALGRRLRLPDDAPAGRDLVVHTSATSAGLQRSLELLAPEGTVVELSWYGDAETTVSLGGASTPAGSRSGPARSGRWRPVAERAGAPPRPARARPRPAARPRVRRAC